MNVFPLLAGLLPLLLFVIVDSFCGLRKGIVVAALAALAELIFSLVVFKTIDAVSITGLVLVLVMGFIAWKMDNPVVFKMQPVILGLTLGTILVGSYALKQPLFVLLMTKYKSVLPAQATIILSNPLGLQWLELSTLYSGIAMLLQSTLVAWAAFRLNNWWWIVFRGVGFYLFLGGAAWLASKHIFF